MPKNVWQMFRKVNNNTPTKHLTHNNLKTTASFQIIKTKAEKVKIKFQSKNTETYNQTFSIAELKASLKKVKIQQSDPTKSIISSWKNYPNHLQISSYKSSMIYGTAVTYPKYGKKPQLYQYRNISKTIQTPKITDPLHLAVVSAKH